MREPEITPQEALRVLAAVCKSQGGSLSISRKDIDAVPLHLLVWQERVDNSGVDIYFFKDPSKKKRVSQND